MENEVGHLRRADDDVGEAADRDQPHQQQDDQRARMLGRRHHPDHGGDEPAGDDALREHLPAGVRQQLPPHRQQLVVGGRVEHRHAPDGPREHGNAGKVAGQHDAPQAQQLPEAAPARIGHHRQHGREGVLGEQLLAREDDDEEADGVTQPAHQASPGRVRQRRAQQRRDEGGEPHRQTRRERRPGQRGGTACQLGVPFAANRLVQNLHPRRLLVPDVAPLACGEPEALLPRPRPLAPGRLSARRAVLA